MVVCDDWDVISCIERIRLFRCASDWDDHRGWRRDDQRFRVRRWTKSVLEEEQEYVYIALVTGIVTFFGFEYMKKNFDVVKDDAWWIEASDALGVGAFCVIGCMNGVRAGVSAINCISCGVMTATGGGVVRDVIVGRPPRIFHSYATAYATPAAAGAATYLIARRMGVSTSARIVAGASVGIVGRLVAEQGNVRLPLYESEEAKTNAKAKGDKRL